MGGGGSHYDRDVKDGYQKTSRGTSPVAEKEMSRRGADPGVLPLGRRLISRAKSPIVYGFDVTASMDVLPLIIFDKMPLIAGQIGENGYLEDPRISVAGIGDIQGDKAPIQIGDFSELRNLDDWLKRIWTEKGGGGQEVESYEFTAYYYARFCDIPNATTPFFLITGDEGFRETLYASDLKRHFGGEPEDVEAQTIFDELKTKFKGNVFLIHRPYLGGDDKRIVHQWQRALGKDHVIILGSDRSIADVTLGLFALRSGVRTLDTYLDDLKTKRKVPQTDARIQEVRKSLTRVATLPPMRRANSADVGPLPLD